MIPWGPSIRFAVILLLVASIAGTAWHYRSVISERANLRLEIVQYQQNQRQLQAALQQERAAALEAQRETAAAREAVEEARRQRAADPESQEWGSTPIPPSAKSRICAALGSCQ